MKHTYPYVLWEDGDTRIVIKTSSTFKVEKYGFYDAMKNKIWKEVIPDDINQSWFNRFVFEYERILDE